MAYADVVLAKSPAQYLPAGEASGTDAFDLSGNSFDGEYVGSPTLGDPGFASGVTAVTFDGTDDRLQRLGLGDIITTASALTLVVWINTTSMPPGWAYVYVVRGSGGSNPYVTLEVTDTGALGLSLGDVAGSFGYLDGPVVADGLPHQIAVTWDDATELLILYVDGVEYDTTAALGPSAALPTFDEVGIADWPGASPDSPLAATLGQFAFYPTALTDVEVLADYNAALEAGPVEVETEVNRDGAIVFDNIGQATWFPAVVPPTVIEPEAEVVAQAYAAPTIDGTQLVLEPTYLREPAYRHRIIVNGRDITFWRGIPTPPMDFQRIQPLGHGAGTLRLPQAVVPFETPGVGDLSWLAKGATVLSQSVDRETNEVVSTDWRGLVIAHDISGGVLTVECGGHAAGRAALQDRQMQLIQYRLDSGLAMAGAIRQLRLSHVPYYGPTTGISLIRWGGGNHLDYINELSAKMTTLDGDQWTTMPNEDGSYSTYLKDLDTIHGTVYLDDARIKADLRSDLAEEPNQIFASGVTPDGMVVKFGAYPGLVQAPAAPYPMNDNSDFGVGTTNAETDTGDGITVMGWRLNVAGYLDGRPSYNDYDAEMGEAIRDLKRDAKLPVTSTMTKAAWAALFDISATGYTLRGIRILPAAATSEITPWRLSANGSIIARNPGYVPSTIAVHRTIPMGAGFTRNQIRQWSQHELGAGTQWRGTIEINTGAIVAGDHTPGDPITELLRDRDIWPGMNLSLPLFAGGIVVHVAGWSLTNEGRTVSLIVDTRPGDTLPVWAAIQRDRENRNTVHRSFFAQRRSASFERENTFDEVGGRIAPITLNPDNWTVFPVVAKQAGTIEKLRLSLSPNREFVVAVFGRRISPARLRRVTNAPLTPTGTKRWTSEAQHDKLDRDHVLLYVAGSDEDPCGYSPGRKSDDDPLTGRWEDDASFPFVTFMNDTDRGSVLWVAVWVGASSTVDGGRIMWPSAEEY